MIDLDLAFYQLKLKGLQHGISMLENCKEIKLNTDKRDKGLIIRDENLLLFNRIQAAIIKELDNEIVETEYQIDLLT